MIWAALYLAVGILILGALGVIDEWIEDLRTHLRVKSICIPFVCLLFWPVMVLERFF